MHLSQRVNKQASTPFKLIHSNVWGPYPIMSPTRFKYFVAFVDYFSHVTWLYLIKIRFELFSNFTAFCVEIQTQFHVPMQIVRSDNAKKSLSEPFQSFVLQQGILHQTFCVNTPSQNGVAKRKTSSRECTSCIVPKHFWVDEASTSCFLINKMPSSVLKWELLIINCFLIIHCFLLSPRFLDTHVLFGISIYKCL